MNRFFAWLMAACVMLCVPISAFAAPAVPGNNNDEESAASAVTVQQLLGSYYEITVPAAQYAGSVEGRVWSDVNGRDDLVKYSAIRKADGTWSVPVDTGRHGGGNMSAEVYADGEYVGSVSFLAPVPKSAGVLAIRRMGTIYSVMVSNLPDANQVRVPVWSAAGGQNDVVWYNARNTGSGTWCAIVQTTRHAGGDMICRVYADNVPVGGTSFAAPRTVPDVKTELCYGTTYDIVIRNLWGANEVQVPTWGDKGGQDDVIWYAAESTAPGTWSARINAANHDEGRITSHVYADGVLVGTPIRVTRDFLHVVDASGESTEAADLDSLSRKKIGWGPGGPKYADGRPEAAVEAQEQYGTYDAQFIMPEGGNVYLTFDEGYENGYTEKILDVLKEKNVKAVFFVTAGFVREAPDLVQRMIDEGHKVGNHTVRHQSMPTLSDEGVVKEVMELHRVVQTQFGYDMELFRFPSGEYCERDLAILQALGYKSLFWSYAYADWDPAKQIGVSAALRKAKNAVHPGALYLLHAVSRDNAQMLGDLIDYCRAMGYTLAQY